MTSYRWKVRLFLFNVSCCLAAAYFFRRHNKYCEAGGECRVHISGSHHDSPLYSLPVSPSFSLHPVRLLRIPGGLLKHGLPHDCLLGLWEQRGDGGDASWGQTILSSSFTCWPFKKVKRGQETGSNSVHTWRPHAASFTLHENWYWSLMIIPTTPDLRPARHVWTDGLVREFTCRNVPIISAEPIAVH